MWWTLLAALVVALAAAHWMRFTARTDIAVDAEGVRAAMGGQELRAAFAPGTVRRVSIHAVEPFLQLGGGGVTLIPSGGAPRRIDLPARWKFPHAKAPPVADWFADDQWATHELAYADVDLVPPFRAMLDLPGRVLRGVVVRFEGEEKSWECRVRAGLMDNTVEVAAGERIWDVLTGGDPAENGRMVAAPLARGIALGAALALGFGALAWLNRRRQAIEMLVATPPRMRWRLFALAVGFLVAARLAFSIWIARDLFDGLPRFQDDFCYLLRARWLLDGTVDRPIPPLAEHFQMPFTEFKEGRWLTYFPLNWSLLLAGGQLFGAAWIVAPLCGALGVWLLFCFGARMAGNGVGAVAALALAVSPLATVLSGSLLNHAATGMLLGLCGLLWVMGWGVETGWREDGRARVEPVGDVRLGLVLGAGAALGFAFGIRPLTAALAGIPTLFLGLAEWRRRGWSARAFAGLATFAGGVVLGALPALIDNAAVTGRWWTFAYAYLTPGTPLAEAFPIGLYWTERTFAQLPMQMFGWGWPWLRGEWWLCLPFGFASVPFLLGRATRHDWWCLGLFLALVAGHLAHPHGTTHGFGARIYSDALWAVAFLVARGAQELGRIAPVRVVRAAAWALLLVLCASTAATLPARMERFRAYNAVDAHAEQLLDKAGVRRALVLLQPDAMLKWLRLARRLPLDPATADLVFAEMIGDNRALLERFGRDRPVWMLEDQNLVPYVPPPKADAPSPEHPAATPEATP